MLRRFAGLAALALLAGACESPNEIGLEVLPGDVPAGATLVEYPGTRLATVAYTDSLLTANRDNLLVGRLVDGTVGATTAEAYVQAELDPATPNPNAPLPATGIIDSLVFQMPYTNFNGSAYAQEPARRLRIQLRVLTESLAADRSYYGDSPALPTGPVVGETTFTNRYIYTYDSLRVLKNRVRTGDLAKDTATMKIPLGDTTRSAALPLRMALHRTPAGMELARQLYAAIGTPTLASLTAIQAVLKGFAIVPAAGSEGAIVNFNPYANGLQLALYYRPTSNDSTKIFRFVVGGDSKELPRKRFFNRLTTDFSLGTALRALTTAGTDSVLVTAPESVSYVQGGVELGTQLLLPDLAALKALKGRILINRAELYVPIKRYTTGVYGLPANLYAYQIDNRGRLLRTNGAFRTVQNEGANPKGTGSAAPLIFDASQNAFRGLLTGWVQAYIDGRLPDERAAGLVLRPTLPTILSSSAGVPSAARVLNVNRALIDAAPGQIRLKVYYSTLN